MLEVVETRYRQVPDSVVTEEPLEIRLVSPGVPARRVAVVMRTPGHDFDLAVGFLTSERILGPGQLPHYVRYCGDATLTDEQVYNVVTVELNEPPATDPVGRFTDVSSACGVCGVQSLDAVTPPDTPPVPSGA
ncbi:MAG: formate dehydrogenase accessory sulfurtransferase FdhD, partial [Sciscionella sp.]